MSSQISNLKAHIPPPTSPHLLIIQNQLCQLGIKHSKIWAYILFIQITNLRSIEHCLYTVGKKRILYPVHQGGEANILSIGEVSEEEPSSGHWQQRRRLPWTFPAHISSTHTLRFSSFPRVEGVRVPAMAGSHESYKAWKTSHALKISSAQYKFSQRLKHAMLL